MTCQARNKIVVGTWPLSGDFGKISLCRVEKIIHFCLENHLVEYDTAPNYGNGFIEYCLGRIVPKDCKVKINTKVGNPAFGAKSFCVNSLSKSFEESLSRLRRENINILFLHNPRQDLAEPGVVIRWMRRLKETGRIRYMGLSIARSFT
jgi:aryl-alcohol dehydrogenase-like predicted oxidoreductase